MSNSIKAAAAFVLLAMTGPACLASDRPNILFIMSDDHAAHAISAYGGLGTIRLD